MITGSGRSAVRDAVRGPEAMITAPASVAHDARRAASPGRITRPVIATGRTDGPDPGAVVRPAAIMPAALRP